MFLRNCLTKLDSNRQARWDADFRPPRMGNEFIRLIRGFVCSLPGKHIII